MSNEELHELVGAYMLGALPPEDHAEFERHLQSCDSCFAEADGMNNAVDALRLAEDYSVPQDFVEKVLAAIPTEPQVSPEPKRRLGPKMLALAASILVAVAIGSFAVSRTGSDLADDIAAAVDAESLVPDTGQGALLTVSDNVSGVGFSNVNLDPLEATERYVLWSLDAEGVPRFLGFVRDEDQQQVTQAWAHDPTTSSAYALSIETGEDPPPAPSERITYVWPSS